MEHSSVNTLLKDITEPTEERAPQTQAPFSETIEVIGDTEPGTKPEAQAEAEAPPSPKMVEAGADMAIALFDLSQRRIFEHFGKRRKQKKLVRLYGEEAPDRLEIIVNTLQAPEVKNSMIAQEVESINHKDLGMLRLQKATDEFLEGLALDEEEKELLKVPLMEIMKQHGGTIPPSVALSLAMLQITGARIGNLMQI